MLEGKTGHEVAGNIQFYILKLFFFSIANILRRFCLRLSLSSFLSYGVSWFQSCNQLGFISFYFFQLVKNTIALVAEKKNALCCHLEGKCEDVMFSTTASLTNIVTMDFANHAQGSA